MKEVLYKEPQTIRIGSHIEDKDKEEINHRKTEVQLEIEATSASVL